MKAIFSRRFSMAHRLPLSGGKCVNVHGHNEIVRVCVESTKLFDDAMGMAASFAELKTRWHDFVDNALDHSLQLNVTDPLLGAFKNEPEVYKRIVVTYGDPTTETLLLCLITKFQAMYTNDDGDSDVRVVYMEIEETPTNTVRLDADDPELADWQAAHHHIDYWWNRKDNSVNSL